MSRVLFFGLILLSPSLLWAHDGGLPGETLGLLWGLPFITMLLSLALFPLVLPRVWSRHYGKIALGLAVITLGSLCLTFGFQVTKTVFLETLFHEYFPFIIMIGTLYTIGGGLAIHIQSPATPLINTLLLTFGTLLAGWIGTTGASMLLIRPLLQMNAHRKRRVHQVVFFIFLVANIGGALTPLGDPPLFLGFLNGVDFFWPARHLSLPMAFISVPLLGVFFGIDTFMAKREGTSLSLKWPGIKLEGGLNGIFLLGVIALVLISGEAFLPYSQLIRDGGLILLAVCSYLVTSRAVYAFNHFSWDPLKEVVKLFFGIFITVIPVLSILKAGPAGSLAPLVNLVDQNGSPQTAMYFWLSGGLSSFLDNAPTYLVFFHMAGGNAEALMTLFPQTLAAISLGSVVMGAVTYIGNAPNFMIKTIAESQKVSMPSFFGYMVWSLTFLLPLFILLAWWRF